MLRPRGLSKLMTGAGLVALASFLGVFATQLPLSAEDRIVATPNNPAVLTAEPVTPPPSLTGGKRDLALEPTAPAAPPASADQSAGPVQEPVDQSTYVSVDVMGYNPPKDGRVEAVVKIDDPASGAAKEIGRFGIYPNAPFNAEDPLDALRFMFKVDDGDIKRLGDAKPKITVELVPVPGEAAEGARLELGKAAIMTEAVPEEQDKQIATPDSPAVVTAKVAPPPSQEELSTRSADPAAEPEATYVAVEVTGYTPPKEGNVQAVVKINDPLTGEAKEIGRFGIFPNSPFQVEDPLDAQRFMFKVEEGALKREGDAQPKVIVDLVPAEGEKAEGARLEVGQALIEKR